MLRALLLAAGGAATSFAQRRLRVSEVDVLTLRQRQVLAGYARGKQTKQIARDLGVSEATVKTHLARAMLRLDASTRAQAVARYVAATRTRRRLAQAREPLAQARDPSLPGSGAAAPGGHLKAGRGTAAGSSNAR